VEPCSDECAQAGPAGLGERVTAVQGRSEPARPRLVSLRPVERPRLYEQLVERLLALVRELQLAPGDRFPPERELAASLDVSRATLRQALVALEVQGVVEVRHGNGAILRAAPPDDAVLDAFRAHARRLPDVIDARMALEVRIAELAALRRSERDLEEIDAALALMEEQIRRGERGLEGDERFHAAVTRAAHSDLLADLMSAIAAPISESRVQSLSQQGRPPRSLRGHRQIAQAIRVGDPRAAMRTMRAHIELVAKVALLEDASHDEPPPPRSPRRR
jgi:GntR family transcriptional regulator, transcriptional repressor for pyruvate dehydrogenase complex